MTPETEAIAKILRRASDAPDPWPDLFYIACKAFGDGRLVERAHIAELVTTYGPRLRLRCGDDFEGAGLEIDGRFVTDLRLIASWPQTERAEFVADWRDGFMERGINLAAILPALIVERVERLQTGDADEKIRAVILGAVLDGDDLALHVGGAIFTDRKGPWDARRSLKSAAAQLAVIIYDLLDADALAPEAWDGALDVISDSLRATAAASQMKPARLEQTAASAFQSAAIEFYKRSQSRAAERDRILAILEGKNRHV